jgi:hypothetical protein
VTGSLTVDVNPDGMHTLAVPERFETRGAFDVVLENHGEPAHVYLNLDNGLSGAATLDATNYYVEQGESLSVTISVTSDTVVDGDLTVATAYGSEKRLIPITVEPTEKKKQSVDVDESLASPAGSTRVSSDASSASTSTSTSTAASPSSTTIDEQIIRRTLPAIVFGTIAIVLALSSLLVSGTPRIVLGVIALLAAILVAIYLALV